MLGTYIHGLGIFPHLPLSTQVKLGTGQCWTNNDYGVHTKIDAVVATLGIKGQITIIYYFNSLVYHRLNV